MATTSTAQRPDGTWAATVDDDTCAHKHAKQANAEGCARWEARAVDKGSTEWHAPKQPGKPKLTFDRIVPAGEELASDEDAARSHEYVPMPELAALWHALVTGAKTSVAPNLLFTGPSGSGKTDGARYLAGLVGLPFTKVDAGSITDREGWFGTRELVVEGGVAVTRYVPSRFVVAIQEPGVTLVDEVTRVHGEHLDVLLPLLDGTREVTNPLTGETVKRHPMNFVIMAGNVGIHYVNTQALEPALLSRSRKVEFEYIDEANERKIVADASGCDDETAAILVNFATETRAKAKTDDQFVPVSTRELIETGKDVRCGLTRDLAVKFNIINGASNEGGSSSIRQELQMIWNGCRVAKAAAGPASNDWECPTHHQFKIVPAGVSTKTGRPYKAFRACPVTGCGLTADRPQPSAASAGSPKICPDCGDPQPAGRTTFCTSCGAALS